MRPLHLCYKVNKVGKWYYKLKQDVLVAAWMEHVSTVIYIFTLVFVFVAQHNQSHTHLQEANIIHLVTWRLHAKCLTDWSSRAGVCGLHVTESLITLLCVCLLAWFWPFNHILFHWTNQAVSTGPIRRSPLDQSGSLHFYAAVCGLAKAKSHTPSHTHRKVMTQEEDVDRWNPAHGITQVMLCMHIIYVSDVKRCGWI